MLGIFPKKLFPEAFTVSRSFYVGGKIILVLSERGRTQILCDMDRSVHSWSFNVFIAHLIISVKCVCVRIK